jgi:hypothetical protein
MSVEEYIASAPEGIRDVLQNSVMVHNQHKETLVKGLLSTNRCKFSETELKAMPLAQLQGMAALADIPAEPAPTINYAGQGVPRTNAGNEDDSAIPAPPLVFAKKSA